MQQCRTYIFLPSLPETKRNLKSWFGYKPEDQIVRVKLMEKTLALPSSSRRPANNNNNTTRRKKRKHKLGLKSRKALIYHHTHQQQQQQHSQWYGFQQKKKRICLGGKERRRQPRTKICKTISIPIHEFSRPHWFDRDGYPLTSRDEDGRFVNPWASQSTGGSRSLWDVFRWRLQRLLLSQNNNFFEPQEQTTNHDDDNATFFVSRTKDDNKTAASIRLTWIGHSTTLVRMRADESFFLLTDPIFSMRASPFSNNPIFNGVLRHTPPSCMIDDLPDMIDVCLLSHDHYDHLDTSSCRQLQERVRWWVVPLGIKEWLVQKCQTDPDQIIELEWWQSTTIIGKGTRNLQITCAPTQHWSGRTMWDRNWRLWCSWAVSLDDSRRRTLAKFYFGGDTGHPSSSSSSKKNDDITHFPLFELIGQRLGPFDLAALPIGAYEPRFFMKDSHVNPDEATRIHRAIGAQTSVGIHWGAFPLADEDMTAPAELLRLAARPNNLDFGTIPLGSSLEKRIERTTDARNQMNHQKKEK